MTGKEFKRITGYTIRAWSSITGRPYYKTIDEVQRGYCCLVQKGQGRGHPLWDTWSSMKTRCYNPKSKSYPRYGGRGIRVCPEWFYSFDAFVQDMYSTYNPKLSLDRIDNNGPYSKGNCRWATDTTQRLNSTTINRCPGVHWCRTAQRWIFRLRKDRKLLLSKHFKSYYLAAEFAVQCYRKHRMFEYVQKAEETLYE